MYTRKFLNTVAKRIGERRKFIQVLIGPRQVGKTTLVNQFLRGYKFPYTYISADDLSLKTDVELEGYAEAARLKLKQSGAKEFLLVIDEIQKIHNWSNVLKKIWDYDSFNKINVKCIILGSSTLLIQKGLTESLAGRYELIYMNHWTFEEMNNAFGWNEEKYCWYGGYPGSADLIKDENRWKKYILDSIIYSTISRDVLMMTRIDKPALMKRLFELGCRFSGQILSYTKMLGQLQDAGNTVTLSHYLHLLDSAGMLTGLEKFSTRIVKQKSSSPKFQVYNTALISAQKTETFKETKNSPDKWGRLIESAVGSHLINYAITDNFKVTYWRAGDKEVDFVMSKGNKNIAIEIKSSIAKNMKGMNSFVKEFKPSKTILISENSLSWKEFLKINPIELF